MKICFLPHCNTANRFSYLISNFRHLADIEICFPGENPVEKNADIFLLETQNPSVTEKLLSLNEPPVIVIAKEGISQKNIRYLPDFEKQFPKLLDEIKERTPTLQLQQNNQRYFYRQKDIVYLQKEKNVCISFRQGTRIISKQSFQKLAKQLSDKLFFPVGTDVLVNAEYVSRFTNEGVWLQNGRKIPFPTDREEQVKNAFYKTKYRSNCSE